MADTYSQIYIQIIFAIQNREASINPKWEPELHKYIAGIIKNQGQKLIAINGTENHIHFLIGMKPNCNLSDLVREIKKASTNFVIHNRFCKYKFKWQEGFGAFSYSHSQLDNVCQYIANQKNHHQQKSFREEYIGFLNKYEIEFKNQFIFEDLDK